MTQPEKPSITERSANRPLLVHDAGGNARPVMAGADGRTKRAGDGSGGCIATGGMIDMQVNGFAGIDFSSPGITPEKVDQALASMLSCGATACLPTLITAPVARLAVLLADLDQAVAESRLGPLMVSGYHLEGPFLSPQDGYCGCHDREAMQEASIEDAEMIMEKARFRPVKIWTVAPEIGGVLELIAHLAGREVLVALGHTAATGEQVAAAAAAGARMTTHLGDGLPQVLPKRSNVFIEQLVCDRLAASVIADGHHLPPAFLKMCLRGKGIERLVLVSDAAPPGGPHTPPGTYRFSSFDVVRDASGFVHRPNTTTCAGSAASMADVAAHASIHLDFSLADIVATTRDNPLALLGQPADPTEDGSQVDFVEWEQDEDGAWRVVAAHLGRLQATIAG